MKESKMPPRSFWIVLCIDYMSVLAGGLLFRVSAPLLWCMGLLALPGFSLLHWFSAKKYWHLLVLQCNLAIATMAAAHLSGYLYARFINSYLTMAVASLGGYLGWICLFLISLGMTVIWFVRQRRHQR